MSMRMMITELNADLKVANQAIKRLQATQKANVAEQTKSLTNERDTYLKIIDQRDDELQTANGNLRETWDRVHAAQDHIIKLEKLLSVYLCR